MVKPSLIVSSDGISLQKRRIGVGDYIPDFQSGVKGLTPLLCSKLIALYFFYNIYIKVKRNEKNTKNLESR